VQPIDLDEAEPRRSGQSVSSWCAYDLDETGIEVSRPADGSIIRALVKGQDGENE
jgi:hypothetical protein